MALPITQITLPFDNARGATTNVTYSNNSFKLNLVKDTNYGEKIYVKEGSIEFPAIDLGQFYMKVTKIEVPGNFPNTTLTKVFTSTSNDAKTFTAYQQVDNSGNMLSPQGRYIRVKVELSGGENLLRILRNDFIQGDSIQFDADNQVVLDGSMYLRIEHIKTFTKNAAVSEGFIYSTPIGNYKKIDKIEVI
ncbi:hypothetical protein M2277_004927 [Paenibacillus sp. LBL]|uniref:hypothetical protein n=1 Tax=Paenibacillus sp. LBL TaxID=2940563 RepID=UPI0024736A36|nr:hypothetical protein [Paenibacillus sp. LBL]MDH6674235.1 hypothetical protein [Paenibacillus sp. LBL]